MPLMHSVPDGTLSASEECLQAAGVCRGRTAAAAAAAHGGDAAGTHTWVVGVCCLPRVRNHCFESAPKLLAGPALHTSGEDSAQTSAV